MATGQARPRRPEDSDGLAVAVSLNIQGADRDAMIPRCVWRGGRWRSSSRYVAAPVSPGLDSKGDEAAAERVAEYLHRGEGKGGGIKRFEHRGRRQRTALSTLSELEKDGFTVGVMAYAELVSLAAQQVNPEDADEILRRAHAAGVVATPRMMHEALYAHSKVGNLEGLRRWYQALLKTGAVQDSAAALYLAMGLRRYAFKVRHAAQCYGSMVCEDAAAAAEEAVAELLRHALQRLDDEGDVAGLSARFLNQCLPVLSWAHALSAIKHCRQQLFPEGAVPCDTLMALMECAGRHALVERVHAIHREIMRTHFAALTQSEAAAVHRRYCMDLQRCGRVEDAVQYYYDTQPASHNFTITLIRVLAQECRDQGRPRPWVTLRAADLYKTLPPEEQALQAVQESMHDCYWANGEMQRAAAFKPRKHYTFEVRVDHSAAARPA
eukprot:TRINITY_DN13341_c0_g1_i1.p1 TRINITY_DN13341_c0_g1~~TRINITY_DN13341_c0_g1_i1.p1  ORF type:complete len:438 (+),score=121.34 TRINITY_DN13341_c0_g1_i1:827-2140(+)